MIRRFFGARVFGFLSPPIVIVGGPEVLLTETSENLQTESGEDLTTEG